MTDVFVFGASGHGKVVIDVIEQLPNCRIVCVADDNPQLQNTHWRGYPIVGRDDLMARREIAGIVAVGANAARAAIFEWLSERGVSMVTVAHPSSTVDRHVRLGPGTVVMAGCVINADTVVGANVIINTAATVDHDCAIGANVHVAPGCRLCGNVSVGSDTLLGAGTIVIPGVRIGSNVVVGAGSTVLIDVPDGAKVAGQPARRI